MRTISKFARFAALPLAMLLPLAAQNPPNDGISRQQADEIIKELRSIRQLLERQALPSAPQPEPPPTHAKLSLQGFQMLGKADAPLTIVEFTDYQCPFCQRFHVTTFGELKKAYIDTGKVRFYSRDLPLDFHANAFRAAQAARCAADQGQFWAMREAMSSNPDRLDMANLVNFAATLKLDMPAFRSCLDTEKYKNAVQTDSLEAMKIGANGTPTFVVGKSTPEGVDGDVMIGAMPFAMFDDKLKSFSTK